MGVEPSERFVFGVRASLLLMLWRGRQATAVILSPIRDLGFRVWGLRGLEVWRFVYAFAGLESRLGINFNWPWVVYMIYSTLYLPSAALFPMQCIL